MTGTIATTITSAYTLTVDPTTVLATGAVLANVAAGYAVNGPAGTAWTLTNSGQISNSASGQAAGGVDLKSGGSVSNTIGGLIAGSESAIYMSGGAGTVTNAGTVHSNYNGIELLAGGTVLNNGAVYGGERGILLKGSAATVTNTGRITNASTHAVVAFTAGGSVTNASGGTIQSSGGIAIYGTNASVAVLNAGSLGGSSLAIDLKSGGYVSNASTGTIVSSGSHSSIYITGAAGTVINAGFIQAATVVGADLFEGGSVTNLSSGTIVGVWGVGFNDASGTLVNYGSIGATSTRSSVFLDTGGFVTNHSGGVISGVYATNGAGNVLNAGRINGVGSAVVLFGGGSVTNISSGTLTGSEQHNGVYISGAAGSVINAGLILSGGTVAGVHFQDGGTVMNEAGGTITAGTGSSGIYMTGSSTGTVINAGIIGNVVLASGGTVTNQAGGTIASVFLGTNTASTVLVDPGAIFTGQVNGSGTLSTLELASASGTGTLSNVGTNYVNFGTIAFDSGSEWMVSGSVSGLASGQTITGFTPGDTIDLTGVTESIQSFNGGTLTLTGDATVALDMPGNFTTASFVATAVAGGTDITAIASPGTVDLHGSASQYIIANDDGTLYVQDTVSGRDGTQILPGVTVMAFTNGLGAFDPDGAAENVARLYSAALDRAPDIGGLEYWVSQIDGSNVPLSSVASSFASSPEFIADYGSLSDSAYVNLLYENVLGRAADPSGAAYWEGLLASGSSRGDVLVGFAESAEYKADTLSTAGDYNTSEAYRLYQAALDRAPDPAGLAYWVDQLAGGASLTQVAAGFIDSTEFQSDYGNLSISDFVSTLYENVLHRAPDPTGDAYWVGQLEQGASEESVLLGFSDSLENRINTASATHADWVFIPT